MNILLESLRPLAEYQGLSAVLESRQAAAASGVGEMTRSHLIASLHHDSGRPVVVVCQDETAARRVQAELAAFLNETPPILPGRELTFYEIGRAHV